MQGNYASFCEEEVPDFDNFFAIGEVKSYLKLALLFKFCRPISIFKINFNVMATMHSQ